MNIRTMAFAVLVVIGCAAEHDKTASASAGGSGGALSEVELCTQIYECLDMRCRDEFVAAQLDETEVEEFRSCLSDCYDASSIAPPSCEGTLDDAPECYALGVMNQCELETGAMMQCNEYQSACFG